MPNGDTAMPEENKNIALILGKAIAGGVLGSLAGYCVGVGGSIYAGYTETSQGGGPAAGGIGALFGLAVGVFLIGPAASAVGLYGGAATAARNNSVDATFNYIVRTWNTITSANVFKTTSNTNNLGWRITEGVAAGIVSGVGGYFSAIAASFMAGFNQTKGRGVIGFARGLVGGVLAGIVGALTVAPAAGMINLWLGGYSTYKNGWEGFKHYHQQVWDLITGNAPAVTKSTPKDVSVGQQTSSTEFSSPRSIASTAVTDTFDIDPETGASLRGIDQVRARDQQAQTKIMQKLQAHHKSAAPSSAPDFGLLHSPSKPAAATPKVSEKTFLNNAGVTDEKLALLNTSKHKKR